MSSFISSPTGDLTVDIAAEFASLLDETSELVCLSDAFGRFTYVNAAWQRTLGYTLDEARELNPLEVIAPEDLPRYRDAARRLMHGETIADFEAVLMARNGGRVVCRGAARPHIIAGPEGPVIVGTRAFYRNVTAERQADAMRARLVATLEASSDFVAIATAQGELTYVNRAGRHLVGISEEHDLKGVTPATYRTPESAAHIRDVAFPIALKHGMWSGESTILGADGTSIPVSQVIVAHPSTRADEPPYFLSTIIRDLRERVSAESALRASEARVRAALDGSLDSFFVYQAVRDEHGQVVDFLTVDINSRAEELTGVARTRLVGRTLIETFPTVRETGHLARYINVVETGMHHVGVYRRRSPNLSALWYRMQVVPLGAGLPDGIAIWTQDITAERTAQLDVALLQRATEVVSTAPDLDTALQSMVGAFAESGGWRHAEAWLPSAPIEKGGELARAVTWSAPLEDPALTEAFATFVNAANEFRFAPGEGLLGEVWVTGDAMWVPSIAHEPRYRRHMLAQAAGLGALVVLPVFAGAEVVSVITLYGDLRYAEVTGIDRLAAIARQLGAVVVHRRAEAARRQAERFKNELIGIVSHELRTPIGAIGGALRFLSKALTDLGPKEKQFLDMATRNSDRLLRLVNDLLDLDRMEAGQIPLDKRHVTAAEILANAHEVTRIAADEAGVTLVVEPSEEALTADANRIGQVLINLAANAIKFSPKGGSVTLHAERVSGAVRFSVADQGRGIPLHLLEQVFERFVQVSAEDATRKGGAGLGLAIAKAIVEQHGGKIWVESTVDHGTTMLFDIPV